jgi:beta-galactosidase
MTNHPKGVAFLLALLLSLVAGAIGAQKTAPAAHTFAIADGAFRLDGKPLQIISGEMHFARIPREYWRHRLRMAKAMGLNTVATYVFWNYHEMWPGVFDFHTGNRDLAAFLRIAQEEGLWVILRPGPYACAEWDFGGFPSYLLKTADLKVRSNDPRFLAAARGYVNALAHEIRPLLVTHGGPILMVQAENEYGSYGSDSAYKEFHRKTLVDAGIDVPLFTSDGDWLFAKGSIPGVLMTGNGETNYDTLVRRVNAFHGGQGPYMVAEFYPGWLIHWAENFPITPTKTFLGAYDSLLMRGASVNLYMFHGGTNFGFTSGANYTLAQPIQPSITSYDYDAPLSEAGWATPKYYALRETIRKHVSYAIPNVPDLLPVIAIPPITLTPTASLFDLIKTIKPRQAVQPLAMEEMDQVSGWVLYRHDVTTAVRGDLDVSGLRDYGVVIVNGKRVATLNRRDKLFTAHIDVPAGGRLEILVENLGRINYGGDIVNNRKGIISPVKLGGAELSGWSMYQLPFDKPPVVRGSGAPTASIPTVFRGSFTLEHTGDTFLDMRGWDKGIVFVNGINLGRYWRVGPQQTLFLPGAWLKRGRNEIVVFETGVTTARTVAGVTVPILDSLGAAH